MLWAAQTQRSLQHFSIGQDLNSLRMIPAYAIKAIGGGGEPRRAVASMTRRSTSSRAPAMKLWSTTAPCPRCTY